MNRQAQIPDLPRIVASRNRIIHGYDTVDDATVWGVSTDHLSALIERIETLMAETGEDT
jgi:uncharacterized protein with HEPN domain